MSNMKNFKLFIAEEMMSKNSLLDLDKALVKAEELWHDATVGKNKKAQAKIGSYAKRYREG